MDTGHYHVEPTAGFVTDSTPVLPAPEDRFRLRQYCQCLRYWPSGCDREPWPTHVEDIDWTPLPEIGPSCGSLTIHERLGTYDSFSVVCYVSNVVLEGDELPRIWLIGMVPEASELSSADKACFAGRVTILRARLYSPTP